MCAPSVHIKYCAIPRMMIVADSFDFFTFFFVRSDLKSLKSPVIVAKIIKSVMHNGLYPSRCVKMSSHKYYIHKDKSIQVVSTSNKN